MRVWWDKQIINTGKSSLWLTYYRQASVYLFSFSCIIFLFFIIFLFHYMYLLCFQMLFFIFYFFFNLFCCVSIWSSEVVKTTFWYSQWRSCAETSMISMLNMRMRMRRMDARGLPPNCCSLRPSTSPSTSTLEGLWVHPSSTSLLYTLCWNSEWYHWFFLLINAVQK